MDSNSYHLSSEKELRKGGHVSFVDLKSLVSWYDNKTVQLASNYIGVVLVDHFQRWLNPDRKMIAVMRTNFVKVYNSAMVGADLLYMFQSFYRMDHKVEGGMSIYSIAYWHHQ